MAITFLRTLILYVCVVAALRLMGKRQIGEMQPKELVITIMIAELAAIPMADLNSPLINGVIAILTLIIVEIILSVLSMKSNGFRRTVNGHPSIIINDGVIDQKALRSLRFTAEELMENLRQQNVFDIHQVQYAVVETTGKLSVMLKPDYNAVTVKDMNIAADDPGLSVCIICDGKVRRDSFALCGLSRGELDSILTTRRLTPQDVFLMTADRNGNYTIIGREKGKNR